MEHRLEFRREFIEVYVDLRKVFDMMHLGALWDLMRFRGIPPVIIGLVVGLFTGTESANSGVRHICILVPSLFNVCMHWVLCRAVDQSNCGASISNTKIIDLDFANNAVIIAESLEVLEPDL